jgi:hypothetical protein
MRRRKGTACQRKAVQPTSQRNLSLPENITFQRNLSLPENITFQLAPINPY